MSRKSTCAEFEKKITDANNRQQLATQITEVLNLSGDKVDTIYTILSLVKEFTAIEAAGIRLKEGEDFPYYETKGFPAAFVEAERYLCSRDHSGEIIRDSECNPYLECMCGNVICGRTDPTLPFFTRFGSFWTNNTTRLLASTTEEDRQARTRNRCNGEGYESVALIPLRSENNTIGLLQLNDSRKDMFSHETISFLERIGAGIGVCLAGRRTQEALEKLTHDLGERVKELNCLYGISKLSNREGITLEGILEETVHIASLAFQYPENICVRLVLEGKEFKTDNFVESSWRLVAGKLKLISEFWPELRLDLSYTCMN